MWELEYAPGFKAQLKKFARKHPAEVEAVMINLEKYLGILRGGCSVMQANKESYVRKEPDGMVAIDERGIDRSQLNAANKQLKATRLYCHAVTIGQTLYLLGIGDKDSQAEDLRNNRKKANKIKNRREA